jgi:hypothetical protein
VVDPQPGLGRWQVDAARSTVVRLRAGRIGPVTVDVSAPVLSGWCSRDEGGQRLELRISLDRLRTRSFVMQVAARALVQRYGATVLSFDGVGSLPRMGQVSGLACAGDVSIPLSLDLTWTPEAMPTHLGLVGTADLGRVHVPLPGLGTIDNFVIDLDAHLCIHAT